MFFFRILYKMAEIVMSLSSDRDEREIDKYHDKSNGSGVVVIVVLQTSNTCHGFLGFP